MGFFRDLSAATRDCQEELLALPFVRRAIEGTLPLAAYRAFLSQAYHHVRHTVPLLMALGSVLPERHSWMRPAVSEYIREEMGHEEWILDDIAASGGDPRAVRASEPRFPAEMLVSYAYDTIHRGEPIGFFGMVHALEGTSVRGATQAAVNLQRALALPESAFSYLRSHGSLDQDHVRFFESLMDRIESDDDRHRVVHCARAFFRLYGDVFRDLEPHLVKPRGDAA